MTADAALGAAARERFVLKARISLAKKELAARVAVSEAFRGEAAAIVALEAELKAVCSRMAAFLGMDGEQELLALDDPAEVTP